MTMPYLSPHTRAYLASLISGGPGGGEPVITGGSTAQYWRGDKTFQMLNKSAVGLGNVDNTADADKPVSTAASTALSGKAGLSHGHATSEVTGLDTALAGKAASSHGHGIADTTGLQAALDAKAAASHAHPLSDVSGLAAGVATFLASPSSANMLAMVTDETGTGSNVFGTAPTLTNTRLAGYTLIAQPAHTSKAAAATLTIAELLTKIIQYTGVAANLTLPTGTLIDAGVVPAMAVDQAFEFTVINTSAAIATLVVGTGITLVGSGAVAAATSITFRARKTAANTFTVYRIG